MGNEQFISLIHFNQYGTEKHNIKMENISNLKFIFCCINFVKAKKKKNKILIK